MISLYIQREENAAISVVIPTLGGDILIGTIEQLNRGTVVPTEILVCIPVEDAFRVANMSFHNLRVIRTDCRGQVAQRAEGFKQASCKYVLQLDDDVVVHYQCLEKLVLFMESRNDKCAISPAIRFIDSDKTVYPQPPNTFLSRTYYYLINGANGYKPGTITKAGTEIGVDPTHLEFEFVEVEWLPGGCVLHSRENLILHNFYPLRGKAFCEDLYHTSLLAKNGIKLFIAGKAIVWIDDPRKQNKLQRFSLKDIRLDYRARKLYLKKLTKSLFWMNIYYILVVLMGLEKSKRVSGK